MSLAIHGIGLILFSYSLDVEGSELQILKTIPFNDVDIKVIDFEMKHLGEIFPGTFEQISSYLNTQGYQFHSKIQDLDAIFVKKGFLDELNESSTANP